MQPDYNVRGINPERLAAIIAHAGHEVLDVGCGSGSYVLHLVDRFRIRGIDYQRFDSWSKRPDLFTVADANSVNLNDNSVDTILSFETLEHLVEPAEALREYYRVCRKNIILTVPNCAITPGMKTSGLVYNHWIDRTHINFWDLEGIVRVVEEAGFYVQEKQYINSVNLGAIVMESVGLKGFVARFGARFYRHILQRQKYPMTCLVVARK